MSSVTLPAFAESDVVLNASWPLASAESLTVEPPLALLGVVLGAVLGAGVLAGLGLVEELLFLLLPQPATASAAQSVTSGTASLACTFDSLVGCGAVTLRQPIPRASYAAIRYLVRAPAQARSGATGRTHRPTAA